MASFTPWLLFILIRVFYELVKNWDAIAAKPNSVIETNVRDLKPLKRRYNMLSFLFRKRMANIAALFNGGYIDTRVLYMFETNKVPCVCFIGEIDIARAFAWLTETFGYEIKYTYQYVFYDHGKRETFFNNTICVLTNDRIVEFGIDYCYVLHDRNDYAWANKMLLELAAFRMVTGSSAQTQVIGFARHPEMN